MALNSPQFTFRTSNPLLLSTYQEDIVLSKEGKVMIHPLPFVYRAGFGETEGCHWTDMEPPLLGTGRQLLLGCGFKNWRAPGGIRTPEAMVWSFGCVVYEVRLQRCTQLGSNLKQLTHPPR